MSIFDNDHSRDEERWITLGLDRAGVLLLECCWWCATFREVKEAGREASAKVRLISARRADRQEAAEYQAPEQ